MAKRRTPEEQLAHHQEQAQKARLRLARARDPRVEVLEGLARLVAECGDLVGHDTSEYRAKIQDALARLVDEAVAP